MLPLSLHCRVDTALSRAMHTHLHTYVTSSTAHSTAPTCIGKLVQQCLQVLHLAYRAAVLPTCKHALQLADEMCLRLTQRYRCKVWQHTPERAAACDNAWHSGNELQALLAVCHTAIIITAAGETADEILRTAKAAADSSGSNCLILTVIDAAARGCEEPVDKAGTQRSSSEHAVASTTEALQCALACLGLPDSALQMLHPDTWTSLSTATGADSRIGRPLSLSTLDSADIPKIIIKTEHRNDEAEQLREANAACASRVKSAAELALYLVRHNSTAQELWLPALSSEACSSIAAACQGSSASRLATFVVAGVRIPLHPIVQAHRSRSRGALCGRADHFIIQCRQMPTCAACAAATVLRSARMQQHIKHVVVECGSYAECDSSALQSLAQAVLSVSNLSSVQHIPVASLSITLDGCLSVASPECTCSSEAAALFGAFGSTLTVCQLMACSLRGAAQAGTLLSLDLARCHLGMPGSKVLAAHLATPSSHHSAGAQIASLCLRSTCPSVAGLHAILESLTCPQVAACLTCLDLTDTGLGHANMHALQQALQRLSGVRCWRDDVPF